MKNSRLLPFIAALAFAAQAQAAGVNYSDIQLEDSTPKSGVPITLNFPGLTSSCAVNISANVSGFTMPGGTLVQGGKLSFVPQSVFGTIDDGFTMTVSGVNYGQGCQGPSKTFEVQVNANRVSGVMPETGVVQAGKPVNINVVGTPYKSCDGAALDFGDGSPVQQVSGPFPIKAAHVYAQAGSYKQSVKANGATCWGSGVADFNTTVLDAAGMTKIMGLQVAYANAEKTSVKITVAGNAGGSCERAFVNWGDGSSPEPVSGNFPLNATHVFQNGGTQTIKVTAADGFKCQGQAQTSAYTYPSQAKFTGVTPASASVKVNEEVAIELAGTGICQNVSVALGDNLNIIQLGAVNFNPSNNFKWPVKVKYGKTGSYTLYVKDNGASACGILNPKVTVGETLQFNPPLVVMPLPKAPIQIAPAPAAPAKPKPATPRKPCAQKNGQQIDPACVAE